MEARQIKRPFDDRIVSQLRRSLYGTSDGLRDIPEMLRSVVDHEIWRERVVEETGEIVRFGSFEEFVEAPPLEGLGAQIRQLKHLCRDNPAALDALDWVTVGERGGDKRSEEYETNRNNVTVGSEDEPVRGNANTYALRKLRKDRPDLHARVLNEEDKLTPHGAMIEAGFRKKTYTVSSDIGKAAKKLSEVFDPDELYGRMKELQKEVSG